MSAIKQHIKINTIIIYKITDKNAQHGKLLLQFW